MLGFDTCEIKEISELPSSQFSVLIGHAYGSPAKAKPDDFIAPNVENFLNLMSKVGNDDSNDGSGLADFNPPPKPELTKQPPEIKEDNVDSSLSPKEFKDLDEYSGGNVKFNQYIPYSTNTQTNSQLPEHKDKLFERLNYVIHLLEENKDHKTQNVTEELVLYMFLGVFVIFVVDSFARANKYTR